MSTTTACNGAMVVRMNRSCLPYLSQFIDRYPTFRTSIFRPRRLADSATLLIVFQLELFR
jgi:hypothetical protein